MFLGEADQRLRRMEEELLRLETEADPAAPLVEVFRDAHTLKGAAAMVGFGNAARIAHAMEDLLARLRAGDATPTAEVVDVLLAGVDGIRSVLTQAAPGARADGWGDTEVEALEATLRAGRHAGRPERAGTAAPPPSAPMPDGGSARVPAPAAAFPGAFPGALPGALPPTVQAVLPDGAATGAAAIPEPRPADTLTSESPAGLGSGGSPSDPGAPAVSGMTEVTGPPVPTAPRPLGDTITLPVSRLDELARLVGQAAAGQLRLGRVLGAAGIDPAQLDEYREMSRTLTELQERTVRARMVPLSLLTEGLHRAVRELARGLGKEVAWEVDGDDTELDRSVLELTGTALLHLLRNAVDHGAEPTEERLAAGKPRSTRIRLLARQRGSEVVITVSDDGRGIDADRVRRAAASAGMDVASLSDEEARYLIFRSGLSTAAFVTDVSGRGVGLDAVRSLLDAVRGRVEVDSTPGVGTRFRVAVPITLAVLPCLLVGAGGQKFAVPAHSVVTVLGAEPDGPRRADGHPAAWHGDTPVPMSSLAATLSLAASPSAPGVAAGPVLVVAGLTRRHGFAVDELVGQRDVVVKGMSGLLPRLSCYTGASVEPDGSIMLVLDASGIIDLARRRHRRWANTPSDPAAGPKPHLLVVDDAMAVRELQRSILDRAGYRVRTASDGMEALALLRQEPADLVLTDVQMPRMDGFALTEAIRADDALRNIAVLILTSLASETDRRRGLDAGADGYIVKSAFNEADLLSVVERLLGVAR